MIGMGEEGYSSQIQDYVGTDWQWKGVIVGEKIEEGFSLDS